MKKSEAKYVTMWTEYLPVIRILLKKSFNVPQQIQLDKIKFEAYGDRLLSGYTFNLEIDKGKVINDISGSAVVRDLYRVLTDDITIKALLKDKKVKINMGADFLLKFKADI